MTDYPDEGEELRCGLPALAWLTVAGLAITGVGALIAALVLAC